MLFRSVFHYNAPSLPFPMQLFIYFFIGLMAAVVDLGVFVVFLGACGWGLLPSVAGAFLVAATVNYLLCVTFLFRHRSRWNSFGEFLAYTAILVLMGALDYGVTLGLVSLSLAAFWAKAWSNAVGFLGNYFLRKFFVFGDRVH